MTRSRSATRARSAQTATATVLVAAALLLTVFAERKLLAGLGPWLGPLRFQLAYNSGVAFNLGDALPNCSITTATAAVTAAVAAYAWHVSPSSTWTLRAGFAAVVAGALSNLIDRAVDGRVTDYLHTGWFPTFNMPDVYITIGAVSLIVGTLTNTPKQPDRP